MTSLAGLRIVVTGGTSMLGLPLVDRLLDGGAEVKAVGRQDGDLRDAEFCKELLKDADMLFHLASHRRNVKEHLDRRDEVFSDNVSMAKSLMGALHGRAVPVVVYSSALVGTLPENADPAQIPDGYLAAKVAGELLWREAIRGVLIIRPVSAYGPHDRTGPSANVVPSLIARCRESKDALEVWGTGERKRAFVYSEDVADATLKLLDKGLSGVQHVSPPEAVTIRHLAETIRDLVQPGLPIRFDPSKPEGPDLLPPGVHSALKGFGWTGLRDGLQRTIDSL